MLVALIARGVAFEFREQGARRRAGSGRGRGRRRSAAARIPLLLGIGLGDMVAGLPIDADGEFTGGFADIFTAYGVWTGLTLLALSRAARRGVPGAQDRRARCASARARSACGSSCSARSSRSVASPSGRPRVLSALAAFAVRRRRGAAAARRARGLGVHRLRGRDGRARSARCSSTSIPNVLVSSTDAAYNLTVTGAASGSYALKVMTVAAVVFFPLVLLYQGWTYRVFRARVTSARQDAA